MCYCFIAGDDISNMASFFGYMGIASALVFCSKHFHSNHYLGVNNFLSCSTIRTNVFAWDRRELHSLLNPYLITIFFSSIDLGAAYGTAKSGVGICSMGVLKPDLIFKSIVPIIMAGILGIYGLIVAVILNNKGKK